MSLRSAVLRLVFGATALVVVTACESSPALQPSEGALMAKAPIETLSTDALLKRVRQMTSRFHSPTQALAAGYAVEHFCVAVPGVGGMGQHWANVGLVDPTFDPLQPEVVLYAPGPDGQPKLVAVEYIVVDVGQEAPTFGTQAFDVGGTPVPVPHWSLHVWLYETNPSGTFAPFNPSVACH